MLLFAIDPGKTTGICVAEWYPHDLTFRVTVSLDVPWDGQKDITDAIIELAREYGRTQMTVLIESFNLRKNKAQALIGSDFPSIEIIGRVRECCERIGVDMIRQAPACTAKVHILDQHRDVIDYRSSEHRRDAYKHLRYYVVSQWSKHKG